MLVDLYHFKQVNDRFGHAAGDAALRECAERLLSTMRGSDLLFRWGGEEFLLVARDSPRERGDELALRLLAAVADSPFSRPDGNPLRLTASIGWAPFPLTPGDDTSSISQVLELADRALYRAKAAGRACAVGLYPAPAPGTTATDESISTEPGFGDLTFVSSLRRPTLRVSLD